MRICVAGEILCAGKFQFPASLSNAKSPLYFHESTNPLFVLVGTEWVAIRGISLVFCSSLSVILAATQIPVSSSSLDPSCYRS